MELGEVGVNGNFKDCGVIHNGGIGLLMGVFTPLQTHHEFLVISQKYELVIFVQKWTKTLPLGGSKFDSAFCPSKVDQMSTRDLWELSSKK